MQISAFTKIICSLCFFFIGAIGGAMLASSLYLARRGPPNHNVLFDGWDQPIWMVGGALIGGIVGIFVILSLLGLVSKSKKR